MGVENRAGRWGTQTVQGDSFPAWPEGPQGAGPGLDVGDFTSTWSHLLGADETGGPGVLDRWPHSDPGSRQEGRRPLRRMLRLHSTDGLQLGPRSMVLAAEQEGARVQLPQRRH